MLNGLVCAHIPSPVQESENICLSLTGNVSKHQVDLVIVPVLPPEVLGPGDELPPPLVVHETPQLVPYHPLNLTQRQL